MNRLRSTTFCASVPSHTEAAMNNASAMMAPIPGERPGDSRATTCANSQIASGMIGLPPSELLFGLFFAQVFVPDDKVREHEAQCGADGPRRDHTPEHPVWKAQHISQRRNIAAITL